MSETDGTFQCQLDEHMRYSILAEVGEVAAPDATFGMLSDYSPGAVPLVIELESR